jgi:hypothetical protein
MKLMESGVSKHGCCRAGQGIHLARNILDTLVLTPQPLTKTQQSA